MTASPSTAPGAGASVTVRELIAGVLPGELSVLVPGADLDRVIANPRIQKSGLALVGHAQGIDPRRIQILGETELTYLARLAPDARLAACEGFLGLWLSCVIVTRGADPPAELLVIGERTHTPLLLAQPRSSATIGALHDFLDDRIAPAISIHGVLVDVFGLGLLLLGKSGIGKSECALDLVARGHRLIADDVVRMQLRPRQEVLGTPAELLRHHLEIRGLGILDVRELYGIVAVADSKRIDLVVELVEWRENESYDRLGLDERQYTLLGVSRPHVKIPVRPGRNIAVIVEIAARNELLKRSGHHSAARFTEKLERGLAKGERQE